ncbi:general secretion pathway protein GspB [Celerinatantimonas sp. MCCC 1A17872]|uniref:general secretion pathway protein GspB n=1 Tax=Celerinatantimonas sp. MCCC 1A17872 TaxID=3177514 RepID=UPI0038C22347
MKSSTSSRFWLGYGALIITGVFITGYGGFWGKSHLLKPKEVTPIGQKIDFPALHPIAEVQTKSVDLIALREQQLAKQSSDTQAVLSADHSDNTDVKPPASLEDPVFNQPIAVLSRVGAKLHIPAFVYNAHVFSSDPSLSYIQLNGRTLHQGDDFLGMTVMKILYGKTIFKIKSQLLEQPALEDYKP